MSPPSSRATRSEFLRLVDALAPLLVGAMVIVVGALIAEDNSWSTGALWTLGLAGALVAGLGYAIPAVRRAPRLASCSAESSESVERQPAAPSRAHDRSSGSGAAAASHAPTELTLGMSVDSAQEDASGLAPERVLVLSGHSSSGKTSIAEHLAKEHPDWAWASCGAFVKSEAERRGLTSGRVATNELGQQLVDELGGEKFLDAVLAHTNIPPGAATLIVDDVYHVEVFDAIKRRWGHLKFVTVDLTDSMRRQLWREEGRTDDEVAALEASPLDEAVSRLAARHRPQATLDGARTDQEIAARTREIDQLVAA